MRPGIAERPAVRARLPAWGLAALAAACGPPTGSAPGASVDATPAAGAAAGEAWFTDRAAAAGIDFVHFNGMSGEYYFNEVLGSGGALVDFDNDGDLDVYLLQGQMLGPGRTLDDALFPPSAGRPLTDRLYRNDLQVGASGPGMLRFTDVTAGSGLDVATYGMGVAAGDFDNDGWTDLYRTRQGPNQLFRNNGDGTFTDVGAASGTDDPLWGVAASFVDADHDGRLDLYVGNYVDYEPGDGDRCRTATDEPSYCAPQSYPYQPDRLYRNRGDGTFDDVTAEAGIDRAFGPALGVVAADLNADGLVDIYVANDGEPNQLWMNEGGWRFRDDALLAGVAVNAVGAAEASMGVDLGDVDGDGDGDLFMTHVSAETNTFYVNDGSGFFADRSAEAGLGAPSLPYTGFGAAWFDADNDTWLDALVVNGAVRTIEALARVDDPFPLHEPNHLFRNLGGGRFEDISGRAGEVFTLSEVSRGAAFGDVDNDGDVDVLVTNNNGPARLLINEVGQRRHWLGLRLVGGPEAPRDMLGARVAVFPAGGGPPLWRRARADGSYASANDPRVLVGLGEAAVVERVRVIWPSGRTEEWTGVEVDGWTTLAEGTGAAGSSR